MKPDPTPPAKTTKDQKIPSAFTLFDSGMAVFKANIGTLLGLIFTPLAAIIPLIVLIGAAAALADSSNGTGVNPSVASVLALALFVLYIGFGVLTVIVGGALTSALLKSAHGEKTGYGESLGVGLHFFWRFLGLSLLIGLAVVVGFILLIVPGLFMLKRYILAPYYLVDQNVGVFEAMKHAAADSKQVGGTWGLVGVFALVNAVGLVPFIGSIASIVGSVLYIPAPAIRYLQIKKAVLQAR